MHLYTTDGTELMSVTAITPHGDGILIDGVIMGAMPMKGVLRPADLRAMRKLISLKLVWTALCMLFRR